MAVSYPPEPWVLSGHAEVGLWLLPAHIAPAVVGKPLRIFGRVIVLAAFLRYNEPSPLSYNEVLATQLVRVGGRPRVTISQIWVDSAASRDGGRDLWSIPKDLATFKRGSTGGDSEFAEAIMIGRLDMSRGRSLPWRLPVRFKLVQRALHDEAHVKSTRVTGWARPGRMHAHWTFDPTGPLQFLAHRKPQASMRFGTFTLTFGSHVKA